MIDIGRIAEQVRRLPQGQVDAMIQSLGESRMTYMQEAIATCYDRMKCDALGIDYTKVMQSDVRKALLYVCVCEGKVEI